jgi:hypothetical protein
MTLNITLLRITTFNLKKLSKKGLLVTLSITTLCHNADYRILFVVMLNVYDECHFAECHYVECRYAECRCALK